MFSGAIIIIIITRQPAYLYDQIQLHVPTATNQTVTVEQQDLIVFN